MTIVDEIHTVTAVVDGETVAEITGRLNEDDTPQTLSAALVTALWDEDGGAVAAAFDEAFRACEAVPGEGALGTARAGAATIEIRRTIG